MIVRIHSNGRPQNLSLSIQKVNNRRSLNPDFKVERVISGVPSNLISKTTKSRTYEPPASPLAIETDQR